MRLFAAAIVTIGLLHTTQAFSEQYYFRYIKNSAADSAIGAFSIDLDHSDPMFVPVESPAEAWRSEIIVSNNEGGSVTYSISPTVPEVQLVVDGGELRATGNTPGTYGPFTLTATADDQVASTSFTLEVLAKLTVDEPVTLTSLEGEEFEFETPVVARGGVAPYTFAFKEGASLPETILIDANTGKLSGTAPRGTHQIPIIVTDASNSAVEVVVDVTVSAANHWLSSFGQMPAYHTETVALTANNTVLMAMGGTSLVILDEEGAIYSHKNVGETIIRMRRSGNNASYVLLEESLLRMDDLGNVGWRRSIRNGANVMPLYAMDTYSNGDVVVAARLSTSDHSLIRLNSTGNIVWTRSLPSGTADQIIIGTDDRIYVSSNNRILVFDGVGNLEAHRSFHDFFSTLTAAPDSTGGIIAAADVNGYAGTLFKINVDGTIAWAREYPVSSIKIRKGIDGSNYVSFYHYDGSPRYGYAAVGSSGVMINAGYLDAPSFGPIADIFKNSDGHDVVVGGASNSSVLKYDPATLDHPDISWVPASISGSNNPAFTTSPAPSFSSISVARTAVNSSVVISEVPSTVADVVPIQ